MSKQLVISNTRMTFWKQGIQVNTGTTTETSDRVNKIIKCELIPETNIILCDNYTSIESFFNAT